MSRAQETIVAFHGVLQQNVYEEEKTGDRECVVELSEAFLFISSCDCPQCEGLLLVVTDVSST